MFENNERGEGLFIVMLVFLVLGWLFVLTRMYVKAGMLKKVTMDDWLMVVSVIIYTVYGGIALNAIVVGGTGLHIADMSVEGIVISLRAWYLCEVLYVPMSAIIRTSIGLFLLRIASDRVHRLIVWTTLVVIWVVSVAYFFIMLLQCSPVNHFWMQVLGQKGSCLNPAIVPDTSIAHSAFCALADVILALMPVAMLWNVSLNKRTKATIALLLSMGIVAGAALIVRMRLIKILVVSPDFIYQTIDVAIWSVMEPSLGIIAGCAATLRPIFKAWGFGHRSTLDGNYSSARGRPGGPGGSGWGGSRYGQKLSDGPSVVTSKEVFGSSRARAGDVEISPGSSDIELNKYSLPHDGWAAPSGGGDGSNRLGEGVGGSWPLAAAPTAASSSSSPPSNQIINVHTSIEVVSHPPTAAAAAAAAADGPDFRDPRPSSLSEARSSRSSSSRDLPLQGGRGSGEQHTVDIQGSRNHTFLRRGS